MRDFEDLKVKITGYPVKGLTYVSYNGIPYHDCMIELKPLHAEMVSIGLEVSLDNTGDTRYDCKFKVVHVKDCEIYLVRIKNPDEK